MTPGRARAAVAAAIATAGLALGLVLLRTSLLPDPADGPPLRDEGDRLSALGTKEALATASEKYLAAARSFRAARDATGEIDSRLSLGSVYERLGDDERALDAYDDALGAAKRSGTRLDVARTANRLGALALRMGDLGSARALAGEAIAAARDAQSVEEQAEALFNLGSVSYSLGAMREAIRYFESSADAAVLAVEPALEVRALLQVGISATMLEQKDRAEAALTRAARLSEERGDIRAKADALRVLGQLHSRLGDSQRALEQLEAARGALAPLSDPATEATILNALGQVYFDLGEKETALRHYQQALERNQRLRLTRREASTLLEIGRCELDLGRGEQSRERFLRALEIYRSLGNRRLEGDVLVELGRLQQTLGFHDAAIEAFDRAIALKLQSADVRGLAYTQEEVGGVHAQLGDHEAALSHYREAHRLSSEADDPLGESLAQYGIARAQRELGRLADARSAIESSLELVESMRGRVASPGLRTSFFASVHDRYEFYVDLLVQLGLDEEAFHAAERARARTLAESLLEAAAGIRTGIDPALLVEEQSLRQRLNEAATEHSLLSPESDPAVARDLANEISVLASEYDRLQSTIRSRSPQYSSLTEPRPHTLPEVQGSLLGDDTRLLAFSLGSRRSFVWSVTREGYALYELPAREEIEELARRAHSELKSPRAKTMTGSSVETLSRSLLGPVRDLPDSNRLLVVADGALGRVPFSALVDGTGAPLVASLEVVRLPAVSILSSLRAQRRGRAFTKWAAVAADPIYHAEDPRVERARSEQFRTIELARLPRSREEALAIQSIAPPGEVDVVLGSEANREWVAATDFRGYRALHFATHGVTDDEHPELSGIVLSLVDRRGIALDGFLRLHEIMNLRLPVDLVVLSACETGLGKEVRGEGLLSLVRGFMYAGAPAVVASSWKVDDEATSELMQYFYRSYFGGASPSAALREAQLALRKTDRFRAPYYWAAFELQGDWR